MSGIKKHIKDADVKGKVVLLRCDFNVPFDEIGNILDDFRVQKTLPTIKFLIENGAKVVLMSHLSPEKKDDSSRLSLRPVATLLENILKIKVNFVENYLELKKESLANMADGEITLFENLRQYQEEEKNDKDFAKKIADLGDIYCNDAFGVSHRAHASVSAITEFLPSYFGFLLAQEVETLSNILQNPRRPLTAIIGGAKLKTKIKVIENLTRQSDHVLLGGNVANVILQAKGQTISGIMPEGDIFDLAQSIDITNPKIHLPVDAIAKLQEGDQLYIRQTPIGMVRKEEKMFDIGPETIKMYREIIMQSKSVFINGPLGLIEDNAFKQGTKDIYQAIVDSGAFSVAGGGETNAFLKENGFFEKINYVSTGGGAMLEFIEGKELPGLKALGYYD